MSASSPTPISVTCPLCSGLHDDCSLCGGRGVLSPKVAEIAEAVMAHMPVPGYSNSTPVVSSTLRMRWSEFELEHGTALDVDDIIEMRVQARVIGVAFDLSERTGELHRVQTVKRLDVLSLDRVASPRD